MSQVIPQMRCVCSPSCRLLCWDLVCCPQDPRIFLQLELQRGVPEVGRREETIQRVDVECTHQNLSTFFNALEQIQEQLDALN